MLEITLATEGRPSSASQKKMLRQEAEDRPRWPVSSGGKHWVFLNKIRWREKKDMAAGEVNNIEVTHLL